MSRVHPALRGAVALVLAAALALAGCATAPPGAGDGPGLTIVTSFAIADLDPVENGYWGNEFGYAELLMRPTLDGTPEPWLLTAVRDTAPTTWELTLREGVRFQNGTPLDAERLVACLRHQLAENPVLRATLPGATVEPTGTHQVRLTTTDPTPNVPNLLAEESLFKVYDQAAYERAKGDPAALVAARIYTGPYTVDGLDAERLRLVPNDDHWAGPPPLRRYEVRFVTDPQARLLAVRNGEADLALYPPTTMATVLEGRNDAFYLTGTPTSPTFGLYLNHRRAPFDDVRVRRAVQRAIDYRQLADDVMSGRYRPATGIYAETLPYAVPTQTTDPAAAAAELDAAGWTAGPDGTRSRDGVPLTFELLSYPQQPDSETLALAVQAQLATVGITVTIRSVPDIDATLKEADSWQAGIGGSSMLSFSGDPITPLRNGYRSDSPNNRGGIADAELDTLIDRVSTEFDEATRHALLRDVQRRIGEQAHVIYLGMRLPNVIAGPRWKGYRIQPALIWVDATTAPAA
ncbi:peptide/nickel transport system substrate-binding protein [Amycolatopsis arida]|uniref:Peptide/nickel transport system substrate-binding protein n=1 Tax=Amycolatopsis arida TaxID=587909 RepID=A0A1I5LT67_9PSEU|nr:ABC transporter substrate-binding protein [Amycolatopsis arida]TDX93831.1 peptide/nickel transport system substrate-binding protein [Amycolatopsis arida]SFP00337.1 peptide/nickel transport system substrate-binding protein [Amycolatopsis arida]